MQLRREELIARNRHLDRALGTQSRGIWIATGVILLAGLVALVWLTSPGERRQRELVERLELGDPSSRAVALLGEAPARCPASSLDHLRNSFPPGWPDIAADRALEALRTRTAERWVYPLSPRRVAGCDPVEEQTEIGIEADGTILWYIAVAGKTPLRLPEDIAPATPAGAPGDR